MKTTQVLFGLLLLLVIGCSAETPHSAKDEHGHDAGAEQSTEHSEESGVVTLTPEQETLAGIQVESVSYRYLQPVLAVPGVVRSTTQGRAVVTPPVAGRVERIQVTLGERVRQGQPLAVIESAELALTWSGIADAQRQRDAAIASLQEARSEVALAAAKLMSARTNLTRQQELVKAGAFSQAPLQQAQSELNDAQSELLAIQKEQVSHAELVRRLENLYKDGLVSRSELEAARLELQQDVIRLDRAQARVAAARTTFERERTIASRGLLNAKELQTAEADVRSTTLEVERAKLRVRSLEAAVANATRAISNARSVYKSSTGGGSASVGRIVLRAPISGVVTHLDVTKGQAVDRSQVLMEVENLAAVWVTAQVPEREVSKLQKGSAVSIRVPSLPDEMFRGIVHVVGNRVDPKTRAVPAQCLVTSAKGLLKPEMFGTVSISYGKGTNTLAIPAEAILEDGDQKFVFLREGNAYHKTPIQTGEKSGELIAVLEGVKEGDPLVIKGMFTLNSELKKDELKGHDH